MPWHRASNRLHRARSCRTASSRRSELGRNPGARGPCADRRLCTPSIRNRSPWLRSPSTGASSACARPSSLPAWYPVPMTQPVNAGLLPVKRLDRAKARLGSHFGETRRELIARALFADALSLCTETDFLEWWVVSDDDEVLSKAREAGQT